VFALAASAVVLREGMQDESRNKFKLVLHCIMIITSVVPPELPMELSLAVTHSLAALSKAHVYCTEPFRIPFAGRLNTLCFDKVRPCYASYKMRQVYRNIMAYSCNYVSDGHPDPR
jgi:cation-transporting ATPase 13A1